MQNKIDRNISRQEYPLVIVKPY